MEVTRLETQSYKQNQLTEFEKLQAEFENYKVAQFESKRRSLMEHQGLLYSMQSQFEEYRTTAEFLFSGEVAKLEDELTSQAMRYEQENLYIVQAKDKFYTDLMVAKDAKIMNLIEGSDLRTLLQQHELDIESLRKVHAREVERVKTDQESEQKSLISLVQRQNSSLESKCEKLQLHIRTLEVKIRDLSGLVDQNNQQLLQREEEKIRLNAESQRQMDAANAKISNLSQEKEHLRHKVIRLNLNARGEGEDTIENMIKRLTREQLEIGKHFADVTDKYDELLVEHNNVNRSLREKEKMVTFLEREVERRNSELEGIGKTFETYLQTRVKQTKREFSRLNQGILKGKCY